MLQALAVPTSHPTTPADHPSNERSAPLRVTGRLKRAIDGMVWLALTRQDAAEHAGLKEHSLYVALCKPHVKAYYLGQLEVLRTSERARNIHTLAEVRDQTSNQMARVQAVRALEHLADDESAVRSRGSQAPGFTIVVVQQGERVMSHQAHIEAKPLSDKDDAGNDR